MKPAASGSPNLPTISARPVRPAEVVAALQLILGGEGQLAEVSQARELMKYTAQRGINLAEIWISEIANQVVWAALPVTSPGRTVLFFGTSATLVSPDMAALDIGLESICGHFTGREVQMAQVLLDPADRTTVAAYARHGFVEMAELIYLQRNLKRVKAPAPLAGDFQLVNYSEQTHGGFAEAVLSSYQHSLDCPALNGVRGIEDILAGHKAAGPFDPQDWFLLLKGGQPVAVLLLSKTHQGDGIELVYLGLAPSVRGHGLANYLMQVAEHRVTHHKLHKLSLAVDSRNEPALKLYYRHGMQQIASKLAMMRAL